MTAGDFALLDIRAGEVATAHVRRDGLAPADIAAIPAAAGGPKGLALLPLDRRLATEWLPRMARIELLGASIGAWRMAALAQPDALAALDRLQHAYVHQQNYRERPSASEVAAVCRGLAQSVFGSPPWKIRDGTALSVFTTRARGVLATQGSKPAFGRAALSNAISRRRLATHMERVVFRTGIESRMADSFDAFGLVGAALDDTNFVDALLASGSIPLVCDPVRDVGGAPAGNYWDGGLIDYHLLLPYAQMSGIVLYPHFVPHVTPGWLDKFLPWRARPRGHPWLSNVVLLAPSPAMLARLPRGKLPDRSDFYRYGTDHASRIRHWERAIDESQRFADAAMRWLDRPDPSLIRPL